MDPKAPALIHVDVSEARAQLGPDRWKRIASCVAACGAVERVNVSIYPFRKNIEIVVSGPDALLIVDMPNVAEPDRHTSYMLPPRGFAIPSRRHLKTAKAFVRAALQL